MDASDFDVGWLGLSRRLVGRGRESERLRLLERGAFWHHIFHSFPYCLHMFSIFVPSCEINPKYGKYKQYGKHHGPNVGNYENARKNKQNMCCYGKRWKEGGSPALVWSFQRPQRVAERPQARACRLALFGWRASDLGIAPLPKSVAASRWLGNLSLTAASSL